MASGSGSRYGSNKLTADFAGRPMFENVFDAIPEGVFERVVVVTPYDAVAQAAEERGFIVLYNNDPDAGQARTIRMGMTRMNGLDGCMFCVCDQPYMSAATIRRMVQNFDGGILASSFNGRRGNPVLFSSRFFIDLASLMRRDTGSTVLERYPSSVELFPAECSVELMDVDSQDDRVRMEAITNFFLTGRKNAGKTTMLLDVLEELQLTRTGIASFPYEIAGHYAGYYLHALSPQIQEDLNDKPISVFMPPISAFPIKNTFSLFGTQYLAAAKTDEHDVVVLDELGRFEREVPKYIKGIQYFLDSPRIVVGVLQDTDNAPWLDEIRMRKDTRVVRVLQDHRDEAREQLRQFLDFNVPQASPA